MRTSAVEWDHVAFHDYVVGHAFACGLEGRAALGSAADIKVALLSKWYRGVERPSPDSLQKVARAIGVPVTDLLVLTGHMSADGAVPLTPAPKVPTLHRLAAELNAMLADDSPLSPARRAFLEESIDRTMEPDRKVMLQRRKPA